MLEGLVALANQASDWARAVWQNNMNQQAVKDQNAYNAPVAQVRRLQQAGLNPALAYTHLQGGQQTEPVTYVAPEVSPVNVVENALKLKEAKARASSAAVHANVDVATQHDLERMRHTESKDRRIQKDMHDLLFQREQQRYVGTDAYSELANYENAFRQDSLRDLQRGVTLKDRNITNAEIQRNLMELDKTIKEEVQKEKSYYNYMRTYGIEKGDNMFLRMGVGTGRPVGEWLRSKMAHFNQKLNH